MVLLLYEGGESIGKSDDGGGSGDVYKGRAEPMLVLLSDSYSDDEAILVSDIRYSSYPAYTVTDYFYQPTTALRKGKLFCPKKDVLI